MKTILYILIFVTSMWLISCGARKSEKSNSEKEITALESLNVVTSDWSKAFENYFSKDNTIIVVREKFINGTISEKETMTKNDKTKTRQKTKETNIYKTYDIYRTHKINIVITSKKTDKKQFNPLWIVIVIGVIYILWDKFKNKIWWV